MDWRNLNLAKCKGLAPPSMFMTDQPTDRPTHSNHGGDRPSPDRWMPVTEAAAELGISRDAVWSRIKRRTLRFKRGDHGRVLVRLSSPEATDRDCPIDRSQTDLTNYQPTETANRLAEMKAEIARLTTERDTAMARLEERDRERDNFQAEIVFLRDQLRERDRQVERMQVLLQAEQQQVRQLADQRQTEPAPPVTPWWHFW